MPRVTKTKKDFTLRSFFKRQHILRKLYLCSHREPQDNVVGLCGGRVLRLDCESHITSRCRSGWHCQRHSAVGCAIASCHHSDGAGCRGGVVAVVGRLHREGSHGGGIDRAIGGDRDGKRDRDGGVWFHTPAVSLSLKAGNSGGWKLVHLL